MKTNISQLNDSQFADLIFYIRQQIGEYNMPITRATLIEDDLGVTGDEAEDLIVDFAGHYNVNVDCFVFKNYFYEEPSVFSFPNRTVKPFTIRHLEKAIIAGRLDERVINSID
jgi:acyl carrier protein